MNTTRLHQLIQAAAGILDQAGMDVIEIGGLSGKDADVVVVGRGEGSECASRNLRAFVRVAEGAFGSLGSATVITRQDHLGYVPVNTPVLHLLFYPTVKHFTSWELPSFGANLLQTGRFLAGDREQYAHLAAGYLENEPQSGVSCSEAHRVAYGALAVSGAVYLSGLPTHVPHHLICLLFRYALRFTLVELLRDGPRVPWFTDALAEALSWHYPKQQGLRRILLTPDLVDKAPREQLRDWHCELFALTEFGCSLLGEEHLMRIERQP